MRMALSGQTAATGSKYPHDIHDPPDSAPLFPHDLHLVLARLFSPQKDRGWHNNAYLQMSRIVVSISSHESCRCLRSFRTALNGS